MEIAATHDMAADVLMAFKATPKTVTEDNNYQRFKEPLSEMVRTIYNF